MKERAVTVACWPDALEFRIEGDPKPFMAQAEGAYFRNVEKMFHGIRRKPLEPGILAATRYRAEVKRVHRGKPNPNPRGGWIGFSIIEPKHSQVVEFDFEDRQPPSRVLEALIRAFDPEAPNLAASEADKEKPHAEGKRQAQHLPDAVRRAAAEGPRQEHAEGQPGGESLLGSFDGRNAVEGRVERQVEPPKRRTRRPVSPAEKRQVQAKSKALRDAATAVREARLRRINERLERHRAAK